jgi:hypothetical protein
MLKYCCRCGVFVVIARETCNTPALKSQENCNAKWLLRTSLVAKAQRTRTEQKAAVATARDTIVVSRTAHCGGIPEGKGERAPSGLNPDFL